ncbi:MAG: Por secretion system C-terminal sorting protein [Rariglobus sp.]|jgi:hypothetical protein|nr:Por secretion system C-terminal sorting protein [Rariglobus sp.]
MKKHISKLAALMLLGCSASYAALVSVPAGDLTGNTTWSASNEYILEGIVYVKNGTLTIPAGTIIRGQPRTNSGTYNPGTLVITTSAKINAVGTATNPIVFTTAALAGTGGVPKDTDADGYFDRATHNGTSVTNGTFLDSDPKNAPLTPTSATTYLNAQFNATTPTNILAALSGGIIILGDAPTNRANTVSIGEGLFAEGEGYIEGLAENADTAFGGIYPLDNSGKLSYVSIRHGGAKLSDANEINGLTLGGVGSGTQIDHIDVYVNFDDGIEIFGGTVNLSYLNINFCEDDGFDVDQGWTGGAQFLFVLQHPSFGDSLLEADGNDEDPSNGSATATKVTTNHRPYAYSVISNGTWVGRGAGVKTGLRMRAGFGGEVLNNVIIQANQGVKIDDVASAGESESDDARTRAVIGELVFTNNTLFGNTTNSQSFTEDSITWDSTTTAYSNKTTNPGFKPFSVTTASGVNPVGLQTGMSGAVGSFTTIAALPNNPAFVATTYRGAFSTSKTTDLWTNSWTALNKRGVLVSKGNQE